MVASRAATGWFGCLLDIFELVKKGASVWNKVDLGGGILHTIEATGQVTLAPLVILAVDAL